MAKSVFKIDSYSTARGGRSSLLKISCAHCGKLICHYQKDGPGPLKRLYLDRIIKSLVGTKSAKVICPKCHRWLGVKGVYPDENRRCLYVFQSVLKTN